MSLAVFAGLVVAYPVNVWLVGNHLKHGMGTVRVLGEGGEPVHPERSETGIASGMPMKPTEVTGAQVAAMAELTLLVLAAGVLLGAAFGNFGL